jgi:hypothetical protein
VDQFLYPGICQLYFVSASNKVRIFLLFIDSYWTWKFGWSYNWHYAWGIIVHPGNICKIHCSSEYYSLKILSIGALSLKISTRFTIFLLFILAPFQISRKRLAVRIPTVKSPLYLTENLSGVESPTVLWRWRVGILSQK